MGNVYIEYDEGLEDYVVTGEFTKAGKTNMILEDENGNKKIYSIDVSYATYSIERSEYNG